jgi:methyl-accepting chemotaxis protein
VTAHLKNFLKSIGARALAFRVDPVQVLADVQALTTKSAVGSASTALRLHSINSQVRQASASLDLMLNTAETLHAQFRRVSGESSKTLAAAGEMEELSSGGRDLSKRAMESSTELQNQMQATGEHIEKLVQGITAIIRVSETIETIARQTTLLSFNATIEAARAGEQGRGFAVVAGEVRSLAQHTEARTKEIKTILDELATELTPARDALRISRELVESTANGLQSVAYSLERIAQLATNTDHNMNAVATVVNELSKGMDTIFGNLKTATAASEGISKDARTLVRANFAVSQMVEECFVQFAKIDADSQFHRGLRKARELRQLAREVFERAIDTGLCSLDDVLAYEYREIKGADIQSLSRLFDVSRVPPEGFTPPKYSTRYDTAVELEIRRVMDQVTASDPSLLYANVIDANLYMPIHLSESCLDWTGIPEKDTPGNRAKRFFDDKWTTTETVRSGMGPSAKEVPNRASRDLFIRAGCDMQEQADSKNAFCVRIQVRDASTVVIVVTVPLFVKGQRYGATTVGWLETDSVHATPSRRGLLSRKPFLLPLAQKAEPTAVLAAVQGLSTKSAVASAITARRLDSVNTQIEQTNASLSQLLGAAEQLHAHFRAVSASSVQTLAAASEMEKLSTGGRELSQRTMGLATELQTQMQSTVERIEKLVGGVTAIIRLSETIRAIARQTTLLSFSASIEAARAGERGKGFALVAGEVRSLAQHTDARTKEIKAILDEVQTELSPAHDALQLSRELVESTVGGVQSVAHSLARTALLATDTDHNMNAMAVVIDEVSGGVDSILTNLKEATASSETIAKHTQALVETNLSVSSVVEESFVEFAKVNLDTQFHRGLRAARTLAQQARELFEDAINEGRCSVEDVLQYEYREIQGSEIQSLSRLFDVSRVPAEGFTPPKYSTRYDAEVDLALQHVMDQTRSSEPMLLYATVVDLNLYMPIHHAEYCLDWTGNPQKDLDGNGIKRFFFSKYITTAGVRVGLGPSSAQVPNGAARDQFVEAGCEMQERPGAADLFSVKLLARGSGTVVASVQVPIFVKGHRYGAVSCGWNVIEE